ncbi:hypothetical protein SAY87_006198 [Trapa incisa]|uniref:Polygalacturonase n=1 Tax=Trapa incisa TaxID=236973 RepID=A0AAN7KDT6_9MYRT|nr:hypothetical protein SAY87_006198 [Trapa incisa]
MASPANSGYVPFFIAAAVALTLLISSAAAHRYNVLRYGARPDGITDSTRPFLMANAATVYVPNGTYLLMAAVFEGPCWSKITVRLDGTLVAPSDYRALGSYEHWILFMSVNKLRFHGGTVDGQAARFWDCRMSGRDCPSGARSVTFYWVNDVRVIGLTSIDSQMAHIVINGCNDVLMRNVTAIAPKWSLNTDGIHIQGSTRVTISGATLETGDDCISIGPGTRDTFMTNINGGPGHGISIGSLGWNMIEDGVKNVTLTNSVFSGSENGVRIKTWARSTTSFVKMVIFENLIMENVMNPIIIDQNYCPYYEGCPNQFY